ncbi:MULTISPECIES: hypothetical protein [Streptomyces]|uniref:hypothetical protein n=1 Tax=Streptomyces TaxID=1883 RepID=UPI0015FF2FD8|nr:hypothetical protein [Streptomyces murinus]MBA9050818.1 hypothetical protein [Streptomyces murinus]
MEEIFKKGDDWVMIRTRWLPKQRCHRVYIDTSDGEPVKVDMPGVGWNEAVNEIRADLLADGYTAV